MEKIIYLIKLTHEDDSVTWMGRNGAKIHDPWSYQLFDFAKEHAFETEDEALSTPNSVVYDDSGDEFSVARVVCLMVW